jgi:glycosyltransferase involved in cell wall biosynthesis
MYSIVIPVYNSADVVGDTVDQTVKVCEEHGLEYELILVNDGSTDESWRVVSDKAAANPRVVAIDFLHNYGQHTAVFAGLKYSKGDYAITMDDDLQNPPEEIIPLVATAAEGYDLVMGRFHQKQHSLVRRLGTRVVGWMNRRIFGKPKDLVLTNFRCIRRDVIDRMVRYRTAYPYIPGLALMFSSSRANVPVEHRPRAVGKSGYSMNKILSVIFRILFNYSSFPLRFVSALGLIITAFSFGLGGFLFLKAVIVGTSVPGWASVAVLLSFFNGFSLLILSMLGEYTVRLLNQSSQEDSYHVKTVVDHHG